MNLLEKFFKPDKSFNSILEIKTLDFESRKIKGIIFDLDDTITPLNTLEIPEDIIMWFKNITQKFKVYIVSNTHDIDRVRKISEILNISGIANAKKPRVKFIKQVIKDMNLNYEEVVIIGDRVFTDIYCGKKLGLKTFLVEPLSDRASFIIRWLRKIERGIIKIKI